MNLKLIAFSLALGLATVANAAADKVVGYFPYWSQYAQFAPKDIRFNMVTHIHYVSISPSSDGSLAFADENDIENFKELSKLAAENNVKLIVSVGGIEQEGTLAEIAASEEVRGTFASNVASRLAKPHGGKCRRLCRSRKRSQGSFGWQDSFDCCLSADFCRCL